MPPATPPLRCRIHRPLRRRYGAGAPQNLHNQQTPTKITEPSQSTKPIKTNVFSSFSFEINVRQACSTQPSRPTKHQKSMLEHRLATPSPAWPRRALKSSPRYAPRHGAGAPQNLHNRNFSIESFRSRVFDRELSIETFRSRVFNQEFSIESFRSRVFDQQI